MKQINLLPKSQQHELKIQLFSDKLMIFWIWMAMSLSVVFILALGTRIYLSRVIVNSENKIVESKKVLDSSDYRKLQDQIQGLNNNIKEIKNLRAQHFEWSEALVELSNLIPAEMQLNSIILERETGRIQITGQAKTREQVIAFWSSVIKSNYFDNINFPLANLEKATLPGFTYTFYADKEKFKTP